MKKPFKVGDRVRVYGNVQTGGLENEKDNGVCGEVEVIFSISPWINVRFDKGVVLTVHPKQCRRLKSKPKAAPVTREERWLAIYDTGTDTFDCEKTCDLNLHSGRKAHLIELHEGEIILSREKLAEAWDACGYASRSGVGGKKMFDRFCTALGLEEAQ